MPLCRIRRAAANSQRHRARTVPRSYARQPGRVSGKALLLWPHFLTSEEGPDKRSTSEVVKLHYRRRALWDGSTASDACVKTAENDLYRTCGKPKSTLLVLGSGQRLVTSLALV